MNRSGGDGEGGALELLVRTRLRIAVGGVVAQDRIADAGKLVCQRAGGLVVIGAALHLGGPGAQAVQRAAGVSGRRSGPDKSTVGIAGFVAEFSGKPLIYSNQ